MESNQYSIKTYLVIIALLLVTGTALSQQIPSELRIQVVNESGNTIDNAFALIGERVLFSDSSGEIIIPAHILNAIQDDRQDKDSTMNDIIITFQRTGYRKFYVTVAELLENRIVVLSRDAISLYGLTVRSDREQIGDRTIIKVTPEMTGYTIPDIIGNLGTVSGLALPGERQTMSLSGHHSRHLTVMIDGVALNKMGQPVDISSIPLDKIDSIEIVAGGASARAGTGAIAGIINLRTKSESDHNEYRIEQAIGSFGYTKTALSVMQSVPRFWFHLLADINETQNNFPYQNRRGETVQRSFNDKAFHNLYLKSVYRHKNRMITHKIDYNRFANKMPGPVNYALFFEDARLSGYGLLNDLELLLLGKPYTLEAKIHHKISQTEYDNTRNAYKFFSMIGKHYDKKLGASLTSNYELTSNLDTSLSLEYNRQDFEYQEPTNPTNSISPVYSENIAARGDVELRIPLLKNGFFIIPTLDGSLRNNTIGNWYHNGSIRYDYSDYWSSSYSYKYLTSLQFDNPHVLIGYSLSENYSLPSFYDLFWKGDCQATGNPDLLPEESVNHRLFGEYSGGFYSFSTAYDKSKVDNLIYWFMAINGWKPGNIASAEINHLSLILRLVPWDWMSLSSTYNQTAAVNRTRKADGSKGDFYGKKLPYRPAKNISNELQTSFILPFANASASRDSDFLRVHFNIKHTYTGKQWTTLDQLIDPLPSYHLTDLEIGFSKPFRSLDNRLTLSLRNILDTDYEIYAYTPQPGFNWMLNLRITNQ